jgi:haloalkane dehalogenase
MNTSGFNLPKGSGLPWQLFLVRRLPFALPVRGLNAFSLAAAWTCTTKRLPALVRKAYVAPYDSWSHRIAVHRFVQDIPLGPKDPAWATVQRVSDSIAELTAERPTMIVWGRKDFVFDDVFLDEWRRRVPRADYLVFDDAGHYVMEDAHETIIPAVRRFLSGGDS